MPRRQRIDFEGAIHFVTNRGTGQTAIVRSDRDRRFFLWLVGELERRFGVQVIAYVLMDNHYHLVLRSLDGQLAEAMQFLDGTHARRFNKVHDRSGGLWQGRYDDRLVASDEHFERVGIYLHLNPQRAGLVRRAVDFPWSSLRAYAAGISRLEWLRLDLLGGRDGETYLADVMRDADEVAGLDDLTDEGIHAWCSNQPAKTEGLFAASDREVAMVFGVSVDEFYVVARGRTNIPRMAAITRAVAATGEPLQVVAHRYGLRSVGGVKAARRRLEEHGRRDPSVRDRLLQLGVALRAAS